MKNRKKNLIDSEWSPDNEPGAIVYVLTTSDGGDNEIFCGVISDLDLLKNKHLYYVYQVRIDSEFVYGGDWIAPQQKFKDRSAE